MGQKEAVLLNKIEKDFTHYANRGGRKGELQNADILHRGSGRIYVIPNDLGDPKKETLVLLANETVITSGPDLYIYLSGSNNSKQEKDSYINAGELKGTKGGQAYVISQPVESLSGYTYALIYCKQFSVLFSAAILN